MSLRHTSPLGDTSLKTWGPFVAWLEPARSHWRILHFTLERKAEQHAFANH